MYKNTKFELTDTNERPLGPNVRLLRLKALRDIGSDVKAGDLGGLVGGPNALSELGECWVYPDAIVYGGAVVWDNAQVRGRARVHSRAHLEGSCIVDGNAQVLANIHMQGDDHLDNVQVVSLMVKTAGQYLAGGLTVFCFDCFMNDRDGSVRLDIPSSRCSSDSAADLALTQAGSRLSYVMYKGTVYPLYVGEHDNLSYTTVKSLLESIDKGTYWRTQVLENVIKMS